MSAIVQKQAQHIRTHDVVIHDRVVYTVTMDSWTDDGLVQLHLRKAGFYSSVVVELSCDRLIEVLEIF